jgi:hypothetical protein
MAENYLTEEKFKSMLESFQADLKKGNEELIIGTLQGYTAKMTGQLDDKLNGFAGRMSKETSAKLDELSSKFGVIDEIAKIINEPDEPATPDPAKGQAQPPAALSPEVEKRLLEIENLNKEREARIKQLEQTIDEKDRKSLELEQQQIEASRRNSFLETIRKIAPKIGLIDGLEEPAFMKLEADKRLQVSEDGKSYLLKTVVQDRFTNEATEKLLPLESALPDLIQDQYKQFLYPRGGAGSNAVPTQNYQSQTPNPIAEDTTPDQLYEMRTKKPEEYKAYLRQLTA